MPAEQATPHATLALSTKVEEDFVSPLTAVRGSLEILRDFPDLAQDERQRFVEVALRACSRLETGVDELAKSVYAAGQQTLSPTVSDELPRDKSTGYADRVLFLEEIDTVEIDFGGFEFSSSQIVNDFYDTVERLVVATGRDWYFLVNYGGCSIWPEAWVAFAHRGKKVNVSLSKGTVRYAESEDARPDGTDPNFRASRDDALARIEELKAAD